MIEYKFAEHAYEMLKERNIRESGVKLAIEDPEKREIMEDGTIHYIRAIEENEGWYLRVVLNPDVKPQIIITVFFDRRIRRSL